MYIYSEKTKKRYDTVEECVNAEKEYDEALAEEQAKKEKLVTERKERAKEVEESIKKTNDLIKAFINDYGSFHTTLKTDYSPFDWFDLFW